MTSESEEDVLKIENMTMHNFLSYADASIRFDDMTIISGEENGAGKTAVAEAICYALTGKLFDVKEEDAVRHGESAMFVSLRGKFLGKEIEIHRSYENTSKIKLVYNGDTYSGSSAKEEIDRIITNDEFVNLVYVDGHNIETLIKGNPSKLLDKIFAIGALNSIIDKLKPNKYEKELIGYNTEIEKKRALIGEFEKAVGELSRKEALKKNLKENQKKIEDITNEILELKKKIDPYEKNEALIKHQSDKLSAIDIQMRKLEGQRKELSDMKKSLSESYSKVSDSISTLTKNKDPDKYVHALGKKIDELKEKLHDGEYAGMITGLQTYLSKNPKITTCPVCDSEITSPIHPKKLEQKSNSSKLLESLTNKKQKIEQIRSKMQFINEKLLETRKKLKACTDKLSDFSKQKEAISPIESISFIGDPKEIRLEIARKDGALYTLQQAVTSAEIQLSRITETESRRGIVDQLTAEIKDIDEKIAITNARIEKVKAMRSGFENILKDARNSILTELNPKIQHSIYSLRKSGNPESDIKYQLNVKDDKYGVKYSHVVERYGIPIKFESLSTGQRAICAIALILAVSDISYHKLNLLIFDELQTSGIDSNAMDTLINAIAKFASKMNVLVIDRRSDIIHKVKQLSSQNKLSVVHYDAIPNAEISVINKIS